MFCLPKTAWPPTCGNDCDRDDNCGSGNRGFGGSWIWIIFLLLIFCGYGNGGCGGNGGGYGAGAINPCCCNVKKTKHGCCKQTCYYPQYDPCCAGGGYGGGYGGFGGGGCGFGGYGSNWLWFILIILFFVCGGFGRRNNCGCNDNNVCVNE